MIFFAIFIWGFSEATLFFIIPDVLLTLYAVLTRSFRKVLVACLICVLGAMFGGTFMYTLPFYENEISGIVFRSRFINLEMIEHVHATLRSNLWMGLITGPLFGVPYKLFALIAPNYTSLSLFLLITIPARLSRFILFSGLAYVLSHYVFKGLSVRMKIIVWSIVWIVGYLLYFIAIGVVK